MSSRERILAHRAQFIAAAIVSAGALGCSDDTAQVCLEPVFDGGADTADTGPMPCLDPIVDTGVMDSALPDTAVTDSGVTDSGSTDSGSTDSGKDASVDASKDTGPMPCLSLPVDGG